MKKKKLIILISSIVMSLGIVTAFAAFIFHSDILSTASTGTIKLESKEFLDYSESRENPKTINALESNSITCYATERGGYSDEDSSLIYLNQLGFSFSFTAKLDSYVRIHFEDAWISKKIYNNGTERTSYIKKAKQEGKSPFEIASLTAKSGEQAVSLPFVYDEDQNYLYIKNIIKGDGLLTSFSFSINDTYFYPKSTSKAYREQILVQVSYVVDVVQANRAEARWGVDLDTILKGGNA